jgi:hypothetical protein
MGVISVSSMISLHRRLPVTAGRIGATVLSYVAYLTQLVVAAILILHPDDHDQLNNLTYILIASMAAAQQRAWMLVRRKRQAD